MLLTHWQTIFDAGVVEAGGKGWRLAQLSRYGLPVPDMLVIPASVEQAWLNEGGFSRLAEAAPRGLRQQLLNHPLPTDLLSALETELSNRGWQEQPLAVRSSATAEDSPETSFAGIHLSRLNIKGVSSLSEAVREIWCSLWQPQAIAYRQRLGIEHEVCAMAVVIMPLLPAIASGIAFTADPLTGRDDRVIIHAHWGLGETLVGGMTTGDEIVLQEKPLDDTLELIAYRPGKKELMTIPNAGGTVNVTTPREKTTTNVFPEANALKLGELARDAAIALDYTRPHFDLEWLWDGKSFWLVQARPITRLARNTYPALQHQPDIWSRGNTCEVTPDPLSPYDWSTGRRLTNLMLQQGFTLIGYPLQPGIQRAALFNGKLYLNMAAMQWEFYDAIGIPPKVFNGLAGGHQPEIDLPTAGLRRKLARLKNLLSYTILSKGMRQRGVNALQQAHATTKKWLQQSIPDDDQALLTMLLEQNRYVRSREPIFFLQTSSGASLYLLAEGINRYLPGEGYALVAALLAGCKPSITAQQGYDLVELAKLANGDTLAKSWLVDPKRNEDWQSALPDNHPFRIAFADFLERYGHRATYESYFRNPRWREAPGYLLDSIRGLMGSDLASLQQHQRQSAKIAKQKLKKALPFHTRPLFHGLLKSAALETRHREAARNAMIAMMEPTRRLLLKLGRRWQQRELLENADDIFNLTSQEIYTIANSSQPVKGIRRRIADRQKRLVAWQNISTDDVILKQGSHQERAPSTAPIARANASTTFTGIAIGTGCATGKVRILRSPVDGVRLNPGDILVAPTTDPSWTPLFLKAGGLVMETGGYLSHGAIVAREFGIPAVVNLPGIMDQLKEGETIEVDGIRGKVIRLIVSRTQFF